MAGTIHIKYNFDALVRKQVKRMNPARFRKLLKTMDVGQLTKLITAAQAEKASR